MIYSYFIRERKHVLMIIVLYEQCYFLKLYKPLLISLWQVKYLVETEDLDVSHQRRVFSLWITSTNVIQYYFNNSRYTCLWSFSYSLGIILGWHHCYFQEKKLYLGCIKVSAHKSEQCRHLSKKYLQCRMAKWVLSLFGDNHNYL